MWVSGSVNMYVCAYVWVCLLVCGRRKNGGSGDEGCIVSIQCTTMGGT